MEIIGNLIGFLSNVIKQEFDKVDGSVWGILGTNSDTWGRVEWNGTWLFSFQ